jgi:S1-C subfamily serine protease
MLGMAACFLLIPGQIETVKLADFPAKAQSAAIAATVRIRNFTVDGKGAEGTGIILGRKGDFVYILTAQHVIDSAKELEIATFTAASYPAPAQFSRLAKVVATSDQLRDLALVRWISKEPIPGSLSLCPARLVPEEQGFKALSVGCGGSKPPTCMEEVVDGRRLVRKQTEDKPAPFWQVDREQPPGRSGGPLIDKRGFLLGVCSGVSQDKGYFCHTEEISAFLERNGFDWLR